MRRGLAAWLLVLAACRGVLDLDEESYEDAGGALCRRAEELCRDELGAAYDDTGALAPLESCGETFQFEADISKGAKLQAVADNRCFDRASCSEFLDCVFLSGFFADTAVCTNVAAQEGQGCLGDCDADFGGCGLNYNCCAPWNCCPGNSCVDNRCEPDGS